MKLVFLDSIITTLRKEKEIKDELVIVILKQIFIYQTSLAWKVWYVVFIYRYMIS